MMLKADFHAHTTFLHNEGNLSPKLLIDQAAELGFDVLAITEHYIPNSKYSSYRQDPLKTYRAFKDYAKWKGILLIPGVELKIGKKEVLLINFKGDIRECDSFESLEKLKEEQKDILVIAPHPFFVKSSCLKKKLREKIGLFDAVEYCHFYHKFVNFNRKAVNIAKEFGKPLVGTSDAHSIFQLNHTYTLVDAEKKDVGCVVDAVKKGKVVVKTKPLPTPLFCLVFFWATTCGIRRIWQLLFSKTP